MIDEISNAKKNKEERVLNDVLSFCQRSGGARTRNAKKVTGTVNSASERPDLILELGNGRVLGLEHFRVDHHVAGGKKASSKSAKVASDLEKGRKRAIALKEGEDGFVKIASETLVCAVKENHENALNASPTDIARSLDAVLNNPKDGHAMKLDIYRKNLAERCPSAVEVEMGFLIELHSDFRDLFLHQSGLRKRLVAGQCPLSEEVYDLLLKVAGSVDWLLLAFYPTLGTSIVGAAIIDCRNGMFKKSCARQGLERTTFITLDKSLMYGKRAKLENHEINYVGDEIKAWIDRPSLAPDTAAFMRALMRGVADAFNCNRAATPFVTSCAVEAFYEALIKEGRQLKGDLDSSAVAGLCSRLPRSDLIARLDEFGTRMGLTGDDRAGQGSECN